MQDCGGGKKKIRLRANVTMFHSYWRFQCLLCLPYRPQKLQNFSAACFSQGVDDCRGSWMDGGACKAVGHIWWLDMHAIFVLASNPAQVMTHLPNAASSTMMCISDTTFFGEPSFLFIDTLFQGKL